jgi:pimeloyl-ACP methyl ester carboxylesterase
MARVFRLALAALASFPLVSHGQTPARPQPLGQLVDLGGYKMHLWCAGSGQPTVILSPGSGGFSFDWSLVHSSIAATNRTCIYDRGGEAWSDLGPAPRTLTQEAFDLRRALLKAGIAPPYVFVGHSVGALLSRIYFAEYQTEVTAMVLVEGVHENGNVEVGGRKLRLRETSKGRLVPSPRSSISGGDRLSSETIRQIEAAVGKQESMRASIRPPFDKLSPEIQKLRLWALADPKHWAASQNDFLGEEAETLHNLLERTEHPLGDLPLVVVAREIAGNEGSGQRSLQKELVSLSSRGQLVFVPASSQYIHIEQPDAVVKAVRKAVMDVSKGED